MLRIAIQAKGRLNEESVELLAEAGVSIEESKRKLLTRCDDFPLEVLYLRDDDIPQAVSMGVADVGIVGLNEVEEKGFDVKIAHKLGFGKCRISLAIPKADAYDGIGYFNGKRVATSYPVILSRFFKENGINADPRNRRLGRDCSVGRDGRRHLRYRQLRRHAGDQRAEGGRKSALLGSGDDLQPIVVGRETSDPVAIAVPHRIGRAQPRHEVRAAEPAARKNRRGDPHPAGHEESDDPSAGSGRLEFDPCRD